MCLVYTEKKGPHLECDACVLPLVPWGSASEHLVGVVEQRRLPGTGDDERATRVGVGGGGAAETVELGGGACKQGHAYY